MLSMSRVGVKRGHSRIEACSTSPYVIIAYDRPLMWYFTKDIDELKLRGGSMEY